MLVRMQLYKTCGRSRYASHLKLASGGARHVLGYNLMC